MTRLAVMAVMAIMAVMAPRPLRSLRATVVVAVGTSGAVQAREPHAVLGAGLVDRGGDGRRARGKIERNGKGAR
ncbi:hypothetical protein ACIQ6K_30730 [Streptomyces sp. NPDC096354]|uniref:hypothetical protein n=1 Tax=Streptomyces sp. NPDC096354 TaxID=3366088 RepID=UPI0037F1805B